MIDANNIKQFEAVLLSYQETQETLMPVVELARQALGDDWVRDFIPALTKALPDNKERQRILDRADHVVHYYGALAAWDEANGYLSGSVDYTKDSLSERLPVLEYWLSLFGDDGSNLINRVKGLLIKEDTNADTKEETVQYDNVIEKQEDNYHLVDDDKSETVVDSENKEISMPEVVPADTLVSEDDLLEKQPDDQKEDIKPENEQLNNEKLEVENKEIQLEADDKIEVEREAVISDRGINIDATSDTEVLVDTEVLSDEMDEKEKDKSSQEQMVDDAVNELELLRSVDGSQVVFQSSKYDDVVDVESLYSEDEGDLPEAEPQIEKVEESEQNIQTESQNWDISVFLRCKKLYDEANNWLSTWCIRMDCKDKTEYPFYGFIVDLMYDLKNKANDILEDQLLDEIIEADVVGGRETVKKIKDAVEAEIEGLPDDFKLSTAEKIKLSAKDILGQIDTSTEKEDIGAPPDGFELMDDPYAVSAEQIISDFEKTEQEAEKQIDKLNVIEENK